MLLRRGNYLYYYIDKKLVFLPNSGIIAAAALGMILLVDVCCCACQRWGVMYSICGRYCMDEDDVKRLKDISVEIVDDESRDSSYYINHPNHHQYRNGAHPSSSSHKSHNKTFNGVSPNGALPNGDYESGDSAANNKGPKHLEDIPEVAEETDVSSPGAGGSGPRVGSVPNGLSNGQTNKSRNNNDGSPPLPPKEKDLALSTVAHHAAAARRAAAAASSVNDEAPQTKKPSIAPLAMMESDNIAGSRPCSIAVPNVAGASPNLSTISEEAAPLTLSLASSRFVNNDVDGAPLTTTTTVSSSSPSNRFGSDGGGVGGSFPPVVNSSTPVKPSDPSFAGSAGVSPSGQLPLPPVSPLSLRDFPGDDDVDVEAAVTARNRGVAVSSTDAPILPPKESTLVLAEPQTHQPKKNSKPPSRS